MRFYLLALASTALAGPTVFFSNRNYLDGLAHSDTLDTSHLVNSMASQFKVEHEGDVVICNVDSMNSDSFLGALQSQWKGLKTMIETATSASVFLHAREELAVTDSVTYIEDYHKCVSQIQQKTEAPTLYVLSASNGSPRMLQTTAEEPKWPHVIWMVPTQVGMFLTTLIFILLGVLSFQCLLAIDAPDVFAEKPLSIEREY